MGFAASEEKIKACWTNYSAAGCFAGALNNLVRTRQITSPATKRISNCVEFCIPIANFNFSAKIMNLFNKFHLNLYSKLNRWIRFVHLIVESWLNTYTPHTNDFWCNWNGSIYVGSRAIIFSNSFPFFQIALCLLLSLEELALFD